MSAVPVHVTVDVGGRLGTFTTMIDNDGLGLIAATNIGNGIAVFIVESLDLAQ